MRTAGFTLTPFTWPQGRRPALTGKLAIADGILRVEYHLSGFDGAAMFPPASENPARRLQLWRHTCFELLWGPLHDPNYWELNASPAGHWNVLAFAGYRRGMREETRIGVLTETRLSTHWFSLYCTIPVAAMEGAAPYRFAAAAILRMADGQRTFWAVCHPGEAPDFHHPLSFTLTA